MLQKKIISIVLISVVFVSFAIIFHFYTAEIISDSTTLVESKQEKEKKQIEEKYLNYIKNHKHFLSLNTDTGKIIHYYTIMYRGKEERAENYEIYYRWTPNENKEEDIYILIQFNNGKLDNVSDSLGYNYLTNSKIEPENFTIINRISNYLEECGDVGGNFCRSGLKCENNNILNKKVCQ